MRRIPAGVAQCLWLLATQPASQNRKTDQREGAPQSGAVEAADFSWSRGFT